MRVLLTGHAGFVGFHILHDLLHNTDWEVIGIDNFSLGRESQDRVAEFSRFFGQRLRSLKCDFSQDDKLRNDTLSLIQEVDYIIHNGAESHVARSYINPEKFERSNSQGTFNMLELARILKPRKFLYTSTDEVFGPALKGHVETDALNPSNVYSASKAAGEMWVLAHHLSFGIPYIITRTTNMFGLHQDEEKFIKSAYEKIWNNKIVDIHTDSSGNIGSRQWLHASNQAHAIRFLLEYPVVNETFHIAGERKNNLEVAQLLAHTVVGKPLRHKMVNAYEMWRGHDLHYALDDSKIRNLGWKPKLSFEEGLKLCVS